MKISGVVLLRVYLLADAILILILSHDITSTHNGIDVFINPPSYLYMIQNNWR